MLSANSDSMARRTATPRVAWVQQESRVVADSFQLPPDVRNQALPERGEATSGTALAHLVEAPQVSTPRSAAPSVPPIRETREARSLTPNA